MRADGFHAMGKPLERPDGLLDRLRRNAAQVGHACGEPGVSQVDGAVQGQVAPVDEPPAG